jgi:transcriptional regulator with XRE-family HTH domain
MEKSIHTREYAVLLRLLKRAREATGLTQVQVAKRLKLSQSFVTKMECGDRRIDLMQLRTICRLYGSTLAEFVAEFEAEVAKK